MILDAATLLAYFDAAASSRWAVVGQIELAAETEELVVSPFVIAELEPLVRANFGQVGWLAVLDELSGGAWTIACFDHEHLAAVRDRVSAGASCAEASVAVLGDL